MLDIRIEEHPAKKLIKAHGIPLYKVAKYLGLSYYHTSHLLSGRVNPSRRVKPKLDKLVEHLEKRSRVESP